jgi:hypothetical protein
LDVISHQAKRGLFPARAKAGAGVRVSRDMALMILIALFMQNSPLLGESRLTLHG